MCKCIKAVLSHLLSAGFLLQEAEKEAVCLKKTLQHSEKELQELRTAVTEKDQKHQRRTARHEQQSRRWAQDIHAECVCLQEFLKHNGLTVENKHSSERCAHLWYIQYPVVLIHTQLYAMLSVKKVTSAPHIVYWS